MLAAARLTDALQALIDLRLDTIDRMLLGRVPRQDRLNIVGEVESRIYELLGERGVEEPTRDDVLAVLARLDPPEAYVPEGAEDRLPAVSERAAASSSRPRSAAPDEARIGKASGIMGLAALAAPMLLLPFAYVVAMVFESEGLLMVALFGTAGLTFVAGLLAAVLAIYVGLRGVWAVVGLTTGALAVLASLTGGLMIAAGV